VNSPGDRVTPLRVSTSSYHSASDMVTPPRVSTSSYHSAGDAVTPPRVSTSSYYSAGGASGSGTGSGTGTESYRTPLKTPQSPGAGFAERLVTPGTTSTPVGTTSPAASVPPKGWGTRRALGFEAEGEGGLGSGEVGRHQQERQWSVEQWVDDVRSKARADQAEQLALRETVGRTVAPEDLEAAAAAPTAVAPAAAPPAAVASGGDAGGGYGQLLTGHEGLKVGVGRAPLPSAPPSESGVSAGGRSVVEAIRAETGAAAPPSAPPSESGFSLGGRSAVDAIRSETGAADPLSPRISESGVSVGARSAMGAIGAETGGAAPPSAPASESSFSMGGRSAMGAIRAETAAAAAVAAGEGKGRGSSGPGDREGDAFGVPALRRQESAAQYPQAFQPRLSMESSATRPSFEGSEETRGSGQ
jgi:hypothetical protein